MTKRLLVMAGGTGGHIFPALAVADELKAQQWQIHWLGTPQRMEAQLVPAKGYPISFIDVKGVRGNGLIRKLAAPFAALKAVFKARGVIKQVKPDVVLGMGGFAAGPGGIAARLCGVPLVIHEQNAAAGLTNRLLATCANEVLCGFEGAFKDSVNARWVGNPLRKDIVARELAQVPHQPIRVLVVGGSLGAQVLNDMVPEFINQCDLPVEVFHQCGAGRQQQVQGAYQNSDVRVADFIEDMGAAYNWADIVICRAGALTVAEIAQVGVAALFVPLPHAVDDHQAKNAHALVLAGAAKMVRQGEQFENQFYQTLQQLLSEPAQLQLMAEKAQAWAKPQATADVAAVCRTLAGEDS